MTVVCPEEPGLYVVKTEESVADWAWANRNYLRNRGAGNQAIIPPFATCVTDDIRIQSANFTRITLCNVIKFILLADPQ